MSHPNYRDFLYGRKILSNNLGISSRSHPSISFEPDKLHWNHNYLTMQFSLLKLRKSSSQRMSKNSSGPELQGLDENRSIWKSLKEVDIYVNFKLMFFIRKMNFYCVSDVCIIQDILSCAINLP